LDPAAIFFHLIGNLFHVTLRI